MSIAAIRYDCVMPFTDMVRQAFSFLESAGGFKLEQRWAAEHPPSVLERLATTLKSWFSK